MFHRHPRGHRHQRHQLHLPVMMVMILRDLRRHQPVEARRRRLVAQAQVAVTITPIQVDPYTCESGSTLDS